MPFFHRDRYGPWDAPNRRSFWLPRSLLGLPEYRDHAFSGGAAWNGFVLSPYRLGRLPLATRR